MPCIRKVKERTLFVTDPVASYMKHLHAFSMNQEGSIKTGHANDLCKDNAFQLHTHVHCMNVSFIYCGIYILENLLNSTFLYLAGIQEEKK